MAEHLESVKNRLKMPQKQLLINTNTAVSVGCVKRPLIAHRLPVITSQVDNMAEVLF